MKIFNQIDDAFQAFITGIPAHRLAELRRLREAGYRIYLLSNTNPIMWNGVIAREFEKEGMRREDYFDGMVTSFEAGCVKPIGWSENVSTLGRRPRAAASRHSWRNTKAWPR